MQKQKFKGSILIFSLIVLGLLLVIAIGIASVSTIERNASILTNKSNQAFQVADSAMEIIKQKIRNNPGVTVGSLEAPCDPNGIVALNVITNGTAAVTFYSDDAGTIKLACADPVSVIKSIKSIGLFGSTTRAVQSLFPRYTKLLLHADGADGSTEFVDSSGSQNTITVHGNAKISTVQVQSGFGGSSASFDGVNSYLSIPDSDDWNFGNGSFTIDFWEYRTLNGIQHGVALARGTHLSEGDYNTQCTAVSKSVFSIEYDGRVYFSSNGTDCDIASTKSLGSAPLNQWSHVAIVRNGNSFFTFRDGLLQDSWTSNLSFFIPTDVQLLAIGPKMGSDGTLNYFNGFIDELRISKGIARWTSNFTPPTQEYTND